MKKHKQIVIMVHGWPSTEDVSSLDRKVKFLTRCIDAWNSLIISFDYNLQVAGFKIVKRVEGYDRHKIMFRPVTNRGGLSQLVEMKFRLKIDPSTREDRIQNFTVGHSELNTSMDVIYEGIRIMQELKKGNIDVLD